MVINQSSSGDAKTGVAACDNSFHLAFIGDTKRSHTRRQPTFSFFFVAAGATRLSSPFEIDQKALFSVLY